jgi:hypothetical protein
MTEALLTQVLEPEAALQAAISKPAWPAVEAGLRKLNQRGLRVVLMLDEFEQLTHNPHVEVSFYNALRSAAGRLRLVFLTCSTKPLIELTCFDNSKGIRSSPFFNIFAQLFLGLLSESEASRLIRTPMEAASILAGARLEDFIYPMVGGHPLALQIACSHAWEGPEDLTRIEQHTRQELEPYFHDEWDALLPAEREVLRNPAKAGEQATGNPALAVALRDLTRKCLLVQGDGAYRFPSKVWGEFVTDHCHDRKT